MVPLDQPQISLDMIRRLVYNLDFQSISQELDSRNPLNASGVVCQVCSPCENESKPTETLRPSTTESDMYKDSLLVGFAIGTVLSCLLYFIWRRTDTMRTARQTSHPVSQSEIEEGNNEVRLRERTMVYT